jgi:transposase
MRYEHYIGVDLHKKNFQACAVTADGTRQWELPFPRTAAGLQAFVERCTRATAVAVEASGPTWHFADAIGDRVGQVVIVDPLKTRLKAGYAAKTDRLDARRLADALRRDSVVGIYQPPPTIRELRELCRSRHALVRTRTALLLRAQAVLLRQGVGDSPRRLDTPAGQRWLAALALPPQATAGLERFRRLLVQTTLELHQVTHDVQAMAAQDPVAQALTTIMGIGPILALMIRAEVGTVDRFPTPAHLASYAGLVPGVEISAGRVRYGRITRRGSPWLRWALVEAAVHGPKRRDAEGRWGRRLAQRKGALKARVAMARRLCDEIVQHWPR